MNSTFWWSTIYVSRSNQSEHWKGPCDKNELVMDHSQYKLDNGFWCVCQTKFYYVTDTHIWTYHAYGYNEAIFQRDSQMYLWLLRYSLFGAISRVNLVNLDAWMLGIRTNFCLGFRVEGRTVLSEAQYPRVKASQGFYCSGFIHPTNKQTRFLIDPHKILWSTWN